MKKQEISGRRPKRGREQGGRAGPTGRPSCLLPPRKRSARVIVEGHRLDDPPEILPVVATQSQQRQEALLVEFIDELPVDVNGRVVVPGDDLEFHFLADGDRPVEGEHLRVLAGIGRQTRFALGTYQRDAPVFVLQVVLEPHDVVEVSVKLGIGRREDELRRVAVALGRAQQSGFQCPGVFQIRRVERGAQRDGFVQQSHVDRFFALVHDAFFPVVFLEHRGERRHGQLLLQRSPFLVGGIKPGSTPHAVGKDHDAGYGHAGDFTMRRAGGAVVVPDVYLRSVKTRIVRTQVFLGFFGEGARVPLLVYESPVGIVPGDDVARDDVVEHIRGVDKAVALLGKFAGVVCIPHVDGDGGIGHGLPGHVFETGPDPCAFAVGTDRVVEAVDVAAEFFAQSIAQDRILDAGKHVFVGADVEVRCVEVGGNLPDERSDHLEGFLPVDVQEGVRKVGLGMIGAFQIGAYGHQGTGMSRGVQFRSEGNAVEAGKGDQLGDLFPRVMLGRGDAGIFLTRDAVVGSTVVPRVVVQV